MTISDETGKNYSYVITVVNEDLAAPSFWTRLLASFDSNKVGLVGFKRISDIDALGLSRFHKRVQRPFAVARLRDLGIALRIGGKRDRFKP